MNRIEITMSTDLTKKYKELYEECGEELAKRSKEELKELYIELNKVKSFVEVFGAREEALNNDRTALTLLARAAFDDDVVVVSKRALYQLYEMCNYYDEKLMNLKFVGGELK